MNYNKILAKSLLIPMLLTATSAFATTYSKRTHFSPRPIGANLAMEYSTWHDKIYKPHKPYIHSHAQVTGFYQGSMKSERLGKYFGIGNGTNTFTVGTDKDINGEYLIHQVGATTKLADTVSFSPKQETWGARIDYFQDINTPIKDLYFKASLPAVYVKNNVHMKHSGSTPVTVETKSFSAADFFSGNVLVEQNAAKTITSAQASLTKGKVQGQRTTTGIADIDLALGAKLFDLEEYQVLFNIALTVPTGTKVHANYLFEPVCGNGQHLGLGFGLDAGVNLWKTNRACIHLLGALNYRYLFESDEERMMGIKNLNLGHYYMAGKIGQTGVALFPATSVLAMPLNVKPGSQIDFLANLSFKSGGFILDLGYNAFYKDEEDVWVKSWQDGIYGLAKTTYDTTKALTTAETGNDAALLNLDQSEFDLDSVRNPIQLTHKFVGGIGYGSNLAKKWPATIGIGGSYEFAQDNTALNNYALWLKGGISF